jgi:hypothetical protein
LVQAVRVVLTLLLALREEIQFLQVLLQAAVVKEEEMELFHLVQF